MCRNLGENIWCRFKLREKSNSGAGADNGAMILSQCCFFRNTTSEFLWCDVNTGAYSRHVVKCSKCTLNVQMGCDYMYLERVVQRKKEGKGGYQDVCREASF